MGRNKYATTEQVNRIEAKVDDILTNHLPCLAKEVAEIKGGIKTAKWIIPVSITVISIIVGFLVALLR